MQLLAQEEYGLRCLIQVARQRGPDPLTIPEIAEREGISPEYAAKLMRALRQTELSALESDVSRERRRLRWKVSPPSVDCAR